MTRAYADIRGSFNRGAAGSRAAQGDYDGAAAYVADDPELANSYAAQGERQYQRQRREEGQNAARSYADAYTRGDYTSAGTIAAKQGDLEGVSAARSGQTEASQRQREDLWRGAQRTLTELEQIEAGEGEGYQEFVQRGRDAVAQNPDMDPDLRSLIERAPAEYNPRFVGALRVYANRLREAALTPEQAAEMDSTNRRLDIQERGADTAERRAAAAERTAEAAMLRAERAGSGGGNNQEFSRANSLRDEYNTQTTGYRTIADFAARSESYVQRANAGQPSGQGDVGLVYALAKIYDPTSVVREGEFAMVARQGGYGEQMQSWVETAMGRGFSPAIREQIMREIRNGVSAAQAQRDQTRTRYEGLAQRAGVDPALVIDDYTAGAPPAGAPPAGGGGALPPPGQRVDGQTYNWTTRSGQPASGVWNAESQAFD
jgi:hypothetical protein